MYKNQPCLLHPLVLLSHKVALPSPCVTSSLPSGEQCCHPISNVTLLMAKNLYNLIHSLPCQLCQSLHQTSAVVWMLPHHHSLLPLAMREVHSTWRNAWMLYPLDKNIFICEITMILIYIKHNKHNDDLTCQRYIIMLWFSYLTKYVWISSILHQSRHDISVVIYDSNLQRSIPLDKLIRVYYNYALVNGSSYSHSWDSSSWYLLLLCSGCL